MKTLFSTIAIITSLFLPASIFAQEDVLQSYYEFLTSNQDLTSSELLSRYLPQHQYYTDTSADTILDNYAYFDSIQSTYRLTNAELHLLKKHHFVVTERLGFSSFGQALHDIYTNDLPVFITTDAILQALHSSYDEILLDLELSILRPQLVKFLDALQNAFPLLLNTYQANPAMQTPLADVDLYITLARSLLAEQKLAPQFVDNALVAALWSAIEAEQYLEIPLFSERNRKIDFSQFTVRGHYTEEEELRSYFKTMMWLGRMDFLLTPPPNNPWESPWTREEIRRMNIDAVLLNELIDKASSRNFLDDVDGIIRFMVGESDNLTPAELASIIISMDIHRADELLNDTRYDAFQQALLASPASTQQILSDLFLMDPFSTEPDTLPISFRLMGQRFIIDSYIFTSVVYDRIVFNGKKVWRPMPDPLDAMFALGNDDAVQLLEDELKKYQYSSQLAALRYLVDAYPEDFWQQSLYNVWLNAIRQLNPPDDPSGMPFFMQTTSWHQEKLTTQLASWAQLRHDNLLYAKQSNTGMAGCSYPHSYVEPYPDFYRQICNFAQKAKVYFSQFPANGNRLMIAIQDYFPQLEGVMDTLATIAQKELDQVPLDSGDELFLKKMLFENGMSGAPPFSGWYGRIYYNPHKTNDRDYLVADVHTQPTDESGSLVGRVLHVGVGDVNLGIFLAAAPTSNYRPMAFVGPTFTYYEKITENFDRLTDERWGELVETNSLPGRPDWVNIYLADLAGNRRGKGRELMGTTYTGTPQPSVPLPNRYSLAQNYPNPFNPTTTIECRIGQTGLVTLTVYNLRGEKVTTISSGVKPEGIYRFEWNGTDDHGTDLSSGVYFYRLEAGMKTITRKMTLVR